ncbi:hypothetical protein KQI69_00605 [Eubacterium sp. MSJ-13]|uniref:hypothetical protein n=1 Tax=Eubacterium sp. MSJ-13 TaxID=2841513 RepID=UPI001C103C91|nr:hypothetical protein [Eubacterium sp. MSJ-13]MBU5477701.1 hypothetical protein [Eubacterium sp. MSJ-13]
MKKLNEKSKIEQFFIIMLMFVALMAMFCLTGCGGCGGCEKIRCGGGESGSLGLSVPGCGGILTSGKGCNIPLWSQSVKCVSSFGTAKENADAKSEEAYGMHACDVRYYGGGCLGCLGCNQSQKSCYNGCRKYRDGGEKKREMFFGSANYPKGDDVLEFQIGCSNGCVSLNCADEEERNNTSGMYSLEYLTGVE